MLVAVVGRRQSGRFSLPRLFPREFRVLGDLTQRGGDPPLVGPVSIPAHFANRHMPLRAIFDDLLNSAPCVSDNVFWTRRVFLLRASE